MICEETADLRTGKCVARRIGRCTRGPLSASFRSGTRKRRIRIGHAGRSVNPVLRSGSPLRRGEGPKTSSGAVETLSRSRGGPVSAAAGRATGRWSPEGGSGAFHEARLRFEWLRAAQRGARGGYRRWAQADRRRLRSEAEDGAIRRRRDAGDGSEGDVARQGRGPPSREAARPVGECLDCKVRGVAAGRKSPRRFFVSEPSRLPRRQERLREKARCGRPPRPIAPDASSLITGRMRFQ
jgi:hypothetical protein